MAEKEIILKPVHYGECFIPEDISLPDFMMAEMGNFSGNVAMIDAVSGKKKTYGQLIDEIHDLTEGLYSEGFKPCDIFAISSTNCSEYFTVTMAALRLGAILTTANPSYTKEELVRQFRMANVSYIFTQPDKWSLMQEVKLEIPTIKGLGKIIPIFRSAGHEPASLFCWNIVLTTELWAESSKTLFKNYVYKHKATVVKMLYNQQAVYLLSSSPQYPGTVTFDDLVNRGRHKRSKIKFPRINSKMDTAAILFSSGTTGLPKGVMITHYNLVANICQSSRARQPPGSRDKAIHLSPTETFFPIFPLFHVAGLVCSLFWPLVQGTAL